MTDNVNEDQESVSPLFNKMDALMARHRGNSRGQAEDAPPVLTELAEDGSVIPLLTEVANSEIPVAGELSPPAPTTHTPPQQTVLRATVATEPEFADLPLLDLEALRRERAPFGPNSDIQIEPINDVVAMPPSAGKLGLPEPELLEQKEDMRATASVSPSLDETTIGDMTASVAAHLAVDISTEVEQLTRRHFAQMMQTLYGEALTRMIDQVGLELETRLTPRIDALVRKELQVRGLLARPDTKKPTPDHS